MNIIVVGDIMIDINHTCESTRNAPEASIPIYNIIETNYVLGGAGNVAININKLQANVKIISVIGDDDYGKKVQNILDISNIKNKCYVDSSRTTTQKYRLFYLDKLVNRHDIETIEPIDIHIEQMIYLYIMKSISNIQAIIISDYNKGVITEHLCKKIIKLANDNSVPTFVDPKLETIEKYSNCFCFKPNMSESIKLTNKTNLNDIFLSIYQQINPSYTVITDGSNGMYLNHSNTNFKHLEDINVVDVTGAGDIALCILVYIWLLESDMNLACSIANFICGKSVQYVGNYCVCISDIYEYYLRDKIIYDYEIEKLKYLNKIKQFNKIVFTNGCFDIIHSAHIKLLNYSKSQGDILIVGLNSDNSIKKLKGETRPINKIEERSELLANLGFVDYIIIFTDESPYYILSYIRPNIIVKGGDYTVETIIGKEFTDGIKLFNFIDGKSSSNTIRQINQLVVK